MGFSRQECWSGLPFPSPGDLPDPGIEPGFPALQADALLSEPPGKPNTWQLERNIALTRWIFVGKEMSLLFNMLSRLVIAFLPRNKHLLISLISLISVVTIYSDFGALQNKVCHCFHSPPICLPFSDGTRCHDLRFLECWALSQVFHSLLFTSIRRFFSSSSVSAKRVISAYLRLLIFLLKIFSFVLHPAQHFVRYTLHTS